MRLAAAALLLLLVSPCFAETTDIYTVELDRDAPRLTTKVMARSDGTVALTLLDGKVEYVQATHVRSIRDQDGIDWTSSILRQGGSLGAGRYPKFSGPEHYRSFRWRPGPPSVCGTYLVTEVGVLWPYTAHDDAYLLVEDGVARNVGASYSVGGTFLVGITGDLNLTGVRARFVRWVSPSVSINLSPGIIVGGSGRGETDMFTPQFTAQAGLNLGGRAGLVVDVFTQHLRVHDPFDPPTDIRDTAWHVGFRVGGAPGAIATLPALIIGTRIQEGWD